MHALLIKFHSGMHRICWRQFLLTHSPEMSSWGNRTMSKNEAMKKRGIHWYGVAILDRGALILLL